MPKHFRELRKAEYIAIDVLEKVREFKDLTHDDLLKKTNDFKNYLKNKKNSLDDILIDAFAVAHRMIQEVYDINLYKVQVMGAYVLHKGDIAEMKTGEGKTLTAILPTYLNALSGKPVYVITVNDYLSSRDAYQVGKVLNKLGISVGHINSKMQPEEKKEQYNSDVIYLTNSEIGFDYLRDNMAKSKSTQIQRELYYAIIDEIDSILIDEARTPLIISGGNLAIAETYIESNEFVKILEEKDYSIDREHRTVFLEPSGAHKAEEFFQVKNLYSYENSLLVHRIQNALVANHIYIKDVEYTVKNDEIILIDIFTGRLLIGRQFSEGLNQAIEAKEGVKVKPENKTLASVTYQNLFRMFKKLSGMSGTAHTEEEEFLSTYNMRVIEIPTNLPVIRDDQIDILHRTKKGKIFSAIGRILRENETGRPVLVGTRSVQDSEVISEKLNEIGVHHEILNAKNHAREAEIVAKAGQKGAITISTNMAGRGTDIKLGEGVVELGGLIVIGTERAEARRIDDQLRGRSGRQGDVGTSIFFTSLEDEIIVRVGWGKKFQKTLSELDDQPMQFKRFTNLITSAQKQIEGLNFDMRKTTLEYDDVLNRQRLIVYAQRQNILTHSNVLDLAYATLHQFLSENLDNTLVYLDGSFSIEKYLEWVNELAGEKIVKYKDWDSKEKMLKYIFNKFVNHIDSQVEKIGRKKVLSALKQNIISSIDNEWQNQIDTMTKLRHSIKFMQYAQKNPLQLYILESNKLFDSFKTKTKHLTVWSIINIINLLKPEEEIKVREVKVFEL